VGDAGPLAAAGRYLGLSNIQLFQDLRSGRSLAQIAKAKGKSVAGLERTMTAALKSCLDRAVAANQLTKPQEQQLLSRISSKVHALVNGAGARPAPGGPPGPFMPPPWAHPHEVPPF
jgi:hypothetical protein